MRDFIESNIGRLLLAFGLFLCFVIGAFKSCNAQTPDEVYEACVKADIQHPEIVTRQAILETGWFECEYCSYDHNNIFGFRWKKEYLEFAHWKRSVYYYKWWQDKWYKGGDYYEFLKKKGYATNKTYISKLKSIKYEVDIQICSLAWTQKRRAISQKARS